MDYLIGDLQGCCDALDRLLARIGYSPSRDRLHVLGDLVNRGPQSLATLRRLRDFGDSAQCLLGNHDLHLLAVAYGVRDKHPTDTLEPILDAPDREAWIDWLRQRRLAVHADGWLMVHAGVVPQWTVETALQLAGEIEDRMRHGDMREFLQAMFGNEPARWDEGLQGDARLRFAINTLTRIRYVTLDGTLALKTKDAARAKALGLVPWFEAPGRRTAGTPIATGHWSALGLVDRPDVLSIDTGCVWGGRLTAVRIDGGRREIAQVECRQVLKAA